MIHPFEGVKLFLNVRFLNLNTFTRNFSVSQANHQAIDQLFLSRNIHKSNCKIRILTHKFAYELRQIQWNGIESVRVLR
jgi:hypothetical protein